MVILERRNNLTIRMTILMTFLMTFLMIADFGATVMTNAGRKAGSKFMFMTVRVFCVFLFFVTTSDDDEMTDSYWPIAIGQLVDPK